MISPSDVIVVGRVNKTHGLNGELSASFMSIDVLENIEVGTCLLMEIDGILVPFFVASVRSRGTDSLLITFDGFTTQAEAAQWVGQDLYMRREDVANTDTDPSDGLYAAQLIGFLAQDADGNEIGEITDIDENEENPLFILRRPDGREVYIPIVDDFIEDISTDSRQIVFDLPDGILDL